MRISKEILPDKLYYTIGEVARMFTVSTSLIRYWEDEFPQITPRKNSKGDRRYSKADIEKIKQIYDLIKEKRFTIEGAKTYLSGKHDKKKRNVLERLEEIRDFLVELRNSLH